MADPRIIQLARLLTNYSVAVKPGDKVILRGSTAALPLVLEVYRAVLQAGGFPYVDWRETGFEEIFFKEANDAQLDFIAPPHRLLIENYDCLINMLAMDNTRALNSADPARQQRQQRAAFPLGEIFMQRQSTGALRWVAALYPTNALAQDADMSLSEFEDFVYAACHVDKVDPVAEWQAFHTRQASLIEWLTGKHTIEVKGPHVDLSLSTSGRTWINGDGQHNMPCGEIFTGPVEDSVNGWVRFSYPAINRGREVAGVELRFEKGQVVAARADKNEAFLQEMLNSDAGARYLGEFAIGTNTGIQRFTRSILFDEKIGGTIHMALGRSYPDSGGKNISAIHWDMICDMRQGGQIWVDGELFYESGRFLV